MGENDRIDAARIGGEWRPIPEAKPLEPLKQTAVD
jgi:hypothetical protein